MLERVWNRLHLTSTATLCKIQSLGRGRICLELSRKGIIYNAKHAEGQPRKPKLKNMKALRIGLVICSLFFLPPEVFSQFVYSTNGTAITVAIYTGTAAVVTISNFVTSIGPEAFQSTNLASITIPDSITSIGNNAFYQCTALTNAPIPASVTNIGAAIFYQCTNLTAITVDPQNPAYSSTNGVLFNQSQTVLVQYPSGASGSYTVPNTVTNIGTEAFSYCPGLISVIIPSNIISLGLSAFADCRALNSAYFYGNAPSSPSGAFLSDPTTVYYLPGTTGWGTSYGDVQAAVFPFGYTTNDTGAIITNYSGSSQTVNIPSSINGVPVTGIGPNAFQNKTPSTITIPYGITYIGTNAFRGDTLSSGISLPNSVTDIGDFAFYGSSLPSITIPGSVTNIGVSVFQDCSQLTSAVVGTGIISIGENAFASCGALATAAFLGNAPTADSTVFSSDSTTVDYLPGTSGWSSSFAGRPAVMLPFNCAVSSNAVAVTSYIGTGGAATIPSFVTAIGNLAFQNCTNITSVTIPTSVTSIGNLAFIGCTGLTSIEIPASVSSIGNGPFAGCTKLTTITTTPSPYYISVGEVLLNKSETTLVQYPAGVSGSYTIPGTVNSIGADAFYSCGNLTGITLPSSVNSIGADAFAYCPGLYSVIVPNSVNNIGDDAFADCAELSSIYFVGNAPSADSTVFSGDNGTVYYYPATANWGSTFGGLPAVLVPFTYATNGNSITITGYAGPGGAVTIPSTINGLNVLTIATNAFYQSAITSVTIPSTVTSLGDYSFASCSSLTNITFNGNAPSADSTVFNSDHATVYYYFGMSGWSSSYEGLVAVELNSLTYSSTGNAITITGFNGPGGAITIPSTINGLPVTSIGFSAFFDRSTLTSITLPNSVTSIGADAFENCPLTNITFGNGLTSIGANAFSSCGGLGSIVIPNSVTSIGEDAFNPCIGLLNVYFNGNAPSADSSVFWSAVPTSVYYLAGNTGWGATFGGRPAVMWNPAIQTTNASFGITNNQMAFTITGPSNIPIVVQASTNLQAGAWINLQSCTLTNGSITFADPAWTNYPGRFYRISSSFP